MIVLTTYFIFSSNIENIYLNLPKYLIGLDEPIQVASLIQIVFYYRINLYQILNFKFYLSSFKSIWWEMKYK